MSGYIDNLAASIIAKAAEEGGSTPSRVGPVLTIEYGVAPGTTKAGWSAEVWVTPLPGQRGYQRKVLGQGTVQQAVQALARQAGVL